MLSGDNRLDKEAPPNKILQILSEKESRTFSNSSCQILISLSKRSTQVIVAEAGDGAKEEKERKSSKKLDNNLLNLCLKFGVQCMLTLKNLKMKKVNSQLRFMKVILATLAMSAQLLEPDTNAQSVQTLISVPNASKLKIMNMTLLRSERIKELVKLLLSNQIPVDGADGEVGVKAKAKEDTEGVNHG